MRSIEELTGGESLWPDIKAWINAADSTVDVLPPADAERELVALQVTTRSALGAITFNTGGILIDHRWLRIIGAGSAESAPSIGEWNGLFTDPSQGLTPGALVCAWDVIGGIFVVNGNRLPFAAGNVCYFAPESLSWFDMEMGYGAFVAWCLSDKLSKFYQHIRWPNWAAEVSATPAGKGLSLYPPPFSSEGKRIEAVSRRPVPALELLQLQIHFGREVGDFEAGGGASS